MRTTKLPTISIITGILNSNISVFTQVLESLKSQNYPKNLIEHIVMDGGSTNGCVELARKYKCKVFVRHDPPRVEQIRPALGIRMARGKIILILESDNILTSKDWLLKMVEPFHGSKNVFCTFSAYNAYEQNMPATTRYAALFGSPDPILYYLKKTEKIRIDQDKYDKGELIAENNNYSIVKFTKDNLPTLGDNGHMFLRKALLKAIKDPTTYTHTDAIMQLVLYGYDTCGVVKNSIIHIMNPHLFNLVKRRVAVKKVFYDERRGRRLYLVYNPNSPQDRANLVKFIFFSLTFVIPAFESLRGYLKIRDVAWFLHIPLCFFMVIGYGVSEIQWYIKKYSR